MKSLPGISRLDDLDRILARLSAPQPSTVEDVRVTIGRGVEDLALRGEARRTRNWRQPHAYRDTTVDALRELVRWEVIDNVPLGDGIEAFDRLRGQAVHLTDEGRRIAALPATERRERTGQHLVRTYPLFRMALNILQTMDVALPELSGSAVSGIVSESASITENQDGWVHVAVAARQSLTASPSETLRPPRHAARPSDDVVAAELGRYLRQRFGGRPPKTSKELQGATNKALAQAYLKELGFDGDWNSWDRCLRWGRDLFVSNDGRHVFGVPGWVAWSTAEIRLTPSGFEATRRGYTDVHEEVARAISASYRRIAASPRSGVQTALLPIYEVRETAAFAARVNDAVADRVLGELAFGQPTSDGLVVRLSLADMRQFVPSARPFNFRGHRFFYVSMFHDPVAQPTPTREIPDGR